MLAFAAYNQSLEDTILCFVDACFSHPDSPRWQFGMGSGSKASFTPFVDPRVYQTSPTEDDEDNPASGD